MDSTEPKSVGIIGAGLAGLMVAALLDKLGFKVSIYEKRIPDKRDDTPASDAFGSSTSSVKRSINLALSHRGICALREIGIFEPLLEDAIRMPQRVIHNINGEIYFQKYGIKDETLWSIGRQRINDYLLEWNLRSESKVKIFFGYSLLKLYKSGECIFSKDEDKSIHNLSFDFVIGADGAYSTTRENILKFSRINFSRIYIPHGYKELKIPSVIDKDGNTQYAIPNHNGLHIWPRGEFMLIALPNPDKSFTVTLFAPYEGQYGFNNTDINNSEMILNYFQKYFPDIIPIMPNLIKEFRENPVGALVTVKTNPWKSDSTMLLGDAAHAIVPFFGQGMNAAFEDSLLFYEQIIQNKGDLNRAAEIFQKLRIPSTNALADLCIEHYEDMAKNTTSTSYILIKKIESILQSIFPERFKSLYRMTRILIKSDYVYSKTSSLKFNRSKVIETSHNIYATYSNFDIEHDLEKTRL
eukprot:gene1714-3319_t